MKTHFFNNWIAKTFLFPNYAAITLFGLSFYRLPESRVSKRCVNHESIHQRQQLECMIIGAVLGVILGFVINWNWWLILLPFTFFYIWYLTEWFISLFFNFFNNTETYHTLAFEEEAYEFDDDLTYLDKRKPFAMVKFLGHLRYK